ncbi:MAG: 4,5-dioxygenase [Oceanospirillaceae bacterium]|nr:4,5-dioxygenase [Oceanospirillaceae bacterium]
MNTVSRPVNRHDAYHAHIYFDQKTRDQAWELRQLVAEQFQLNVGRFHEKTVGPHPHWSCQVVFGTRDFEQFIPWLDAHRHGLTILVHGVTGDDLRDHTENAYWLGEPAELNLSQFL